MVLEVKSICCVESLRKIPEIFGLEKGMSFLQGKKKKRICDVYHFNGMMIMKFYNFRWKLVEQCLLFVVRENGHVSIRQ